MVLKFCPKCGKEYNPNTKHLCTIQDITITPTKRYSPTKYVGKTTLALFMLVCIGFGTWGIIFDFLICIMLLVQHFIKKQPSINWSYPSQVLEIKLRKEDNHPEEKTEFYHEGDKKYPDPTDADVLEFNL